MLNKFYKSMEQLNSIEIFLKQVSDLFYKDEFHLAFQLISDIGNYSYLFLFIPKNLK